MTEFARFLEAHRTRKAFDFAWFIAMWDRAFPEDRYIIR